MNPSSDLVASLAPGIRERAVAAADVDGESRLLLPLLRWLVKSRRIDSRTRIVLELPWLGRRVDVATLSQRRRTTAYELKLGSLGRALEQASYNRSAFDRSYVVTGSVPRPENLALAAEHDIGIILIREGRVVRLLPSPIRSPVPRLRPRLLMKFGLPQAVPRV